MSDSCHTRSEVRIEIFKDSRWGINLRETYTCSQCGETLPSRHKPANLRQLLWGGWTCPQCGEELDKWCQPVAHRVSSEVSKQSDSIQ